MSRYIPIFQAEIDAGIAEQVRTQASIAYLIEPQTYVPSSEQMERIAAALHAVGVQNKVLAGLTDSDLYLNKSILASTNWNKNDDIFDPLETWHARSTPIHKPSNLEHVDTSIIGHMIDTWCIDENAKIIANNLADDHVPAFFHLIDASVIYRVWSNEKVKEKVEELIAKIDKKEALVSMECLFSGFNYGIITPEGDQRVVARATDTAFLTKHLRAYGGTGEYEGCKIGRIMRNMSFSGKGYVVRPANPASSAFPWESVIDFSTATEINPFSKRNGVSIFCGDTQQSKAAKPNNDKENSNMSDVVNKVLEDQVAELKASVKALTEDNKTLAEKSTKASVDKLELSVTDLTKKLEASVSDVTALTKELADAKAASVKAAADLEAANTAKAALETDLGKIKAEAAKAARVATLVAGGVSAEDAAATVEKFASSSDEQFALVAEFAIKAAKPAPFESKDDKNGKKEKKEGCKATASDADESGASADLESVETDEEPNLAAAGSEEGEDVATETRKALAGWLESRIAGGSKAKAKATK